MCALFILWKSSSDCFYFFIILATLWDLPEPGMEPKPVAVGTWSLNHWTTREVPIVLQSGLFRPHQNYGIRKPSKNLPTQTFNRLLTRRISMFQQFLKRRLFLSQLLHFTLRTVSLSFFLQVLADWSVISELLAPYYMKSFFSDGVFCSSSYVLDPGVLLSQNSPCMSTRCWESLSDFVNDQLVCRLPPTFPIFPPPLPSLSILPCNQNKSTTLFLT